MLDDHQTAADYAREATLATPARPHQPMVAAELCCPAHVSFQNFCTSDKLVALEDHADASPRHRALRGYGHTSYMPQAMQSWAHAAHIPLTVGFPRDSHLAHQKSRVEHWQPGSPDD